MLMTTVEKVLCENMDRIKETYQLPDVIEDNDDIVLPEPDYIFYLCYKLNYWMGQNVINKVFRYFQLLVRYLDKNHIVFENLDDTCQITIIAAKYYVRGVLRVKEVYNL